MAQARKQFHVVQRQNVKQALSLLLSLVFLINTGGTMSAQDASDQKSKSSANASDLTIQKQVDDAATSLLDGKVSDAITSYTSALKDQKLPNDYRATLLNDRAVAFAQDGQFKSSLEDFNAAVQLYPEYAAIYNNRGILLITLGQYKEALKDFNRAIFLSPKYAAAYNNRGSLYIKLGQKGDGLDDFSKAIELVPYSPELLNSRGRANLYLKRPYSAIRDFTHSVEGLSRFSSAYRNRAEAKIMLQAYSSAIEDYSRAIAFNSQNPELYYLRAEAYLMAEDKTSALDDFNRAISINASYDSAYVGRGLTYYKLGKFDDALADLERAVNLNSQSANAYAYRAIVHMKMEQVDLAKADMETALKYNDKLPEVLWAKASLEEELGQIDQAILDVRQALEQKPWLKEAIDMQLRLIPGSLDQPVDPLENSNSETWRLIRRNGQILALNELYPRLAIRLDMVEDITPKLLLWEIKQGPFEGYGILKYSAGSLLTSRGSEECEMTILLDLLQQRVVAILPERQGSKTSVWAWEDKGIIVQALDGLRDEFPLLEEQGRVGPVASSGSVNRRVTTQTYTKDWAPWNQPLGMPDPGVERRRRTNNSTQQLKSSKSFFDLFFN